MTPNQLVKTVAACTGLSEQTVVQHDRNLVVAGLRTKSGRGRSAARVTHLDAARLTVACLGSLRVKDSVDTVLSHEATAMNLGRSEFAQKRAIPGIPQPPRNHNFVEMVAAIIQGADSDEMASNFAKASELFSPIRVTVSYPWTSAEVCFYDDDPDFGGDDFTGGSLIARCVYTPSVSRALIPPENDKAAFAAWWRKEEKARVDADFWEDMPDVLCIRQHRVLHGDSFIQIGLAFRDDGVDRLGFAAEASTEKGSEK